MKVPLLFSNLEKVPEFALSSGSEYKSFVWFGCAKAWSKGKEIIKIKEKREIIDAMIKRVEDIIDRVEL